MAEVNLNKNVPFEENETLEPINGNGNREAAEQSKILQNDEDDDKGDFLISK